MVGLVEAGVDVFGLGAEMRMLARTAKLDNKLPEDLEQMLAVDARAGVVEAMRKSAARQGIDEIVITHEHLQVCSRFIPLSGVSGVQTPSP
jgi:hypothetical protein